MYRKLNNYDFNFSHSIFWLVYLLFCIKKSEQEKIHRDRTLRSAKTTLQP